MVMTVNDWKDLGVQTFGLTSDLLVPIAAANKLSIEKYIGTIQKIIPGRKREINALVVKAAQPEKNPSVKLWHQSVGSKYYSILHPQLQFWVHVDYNGYRNAWHRLGFEKLNSEAFLDHIFNRTAAKISGYRQQFIRLCPISRATNTNSGANTGAEGLHKTEVRKLKSQPEHIKKAMLKSLEAPVILADPIDMTKMLDISPGLSELLGVAAILTHFYIS